MDIKFQNRLQNLEKYKEMVVAKIIICDLVHKKDYPIIDKLEAPLARKIVNILNKNLPSDKIKVRIRFVKPEII